MFHTLVIVGNLGREPEMRYTPGGAAVTNFSVATNRQYTNGAGEKVEEVCWFRISVWGKMAEACNKYLKKGSKVLVEGNLRPDENGSPRVYESGGKHGASYEVNAQVVRFLSGRGDGVEDSAETTTTEIPF